MHAKIHGQTLPVLTIKLVIELVVAVVSSLDGMMKSLEYSDSVHRPDTRSIGVNLVNWTDNKVFLADSGTLALRKQSINN